MGSSLVSKKNMSPLYVQLSLQLCGEEGRGLVATKSIRKGQRLLQVPRKLLLNVEAVMAGEGIVLSFRA